MQLAKEKTVLYLHVRCETCADPHLHGWGYTEPATEYGEPDWYILNRIAGQPDLREPGHNDHDLTVIEEVH